MPLGPMNASGGAVGHAAGVLDEHRHLAVGRDRPHDVAQHVAEPERAVRPPERAFGELEAARDLLDDGAGRDQRVERRIEPLDLADRVRWRGPAAVAGGGAEECRGAGAAASGRHQAGERQHEHAVASTSRYTSSYSTTG